MSLSLPNSSPWRARFRLAIWVILAKLTVVLIIFLAYKLLPFAVDNYQVNFVDPAHADSPLEVIFTTWDGQHFLYLSENGYQAGLLSDNQFPLYPALIRLVTPLFGAVRGALIISNVASLIGFILLFDLLKDLYSEDVAWRSVVLYAAFPTAFYFVVAYSESLFFLLVALFFRLLFKRKLGWAALPAALAPLARAPGFLLLAPFIVFYLVEVVGLGQRRLGVAPTRQRALDEDEPAEAWPEKRQANLAALRSPSALLTLSPLVGVGAYLLFMYMATGNPFEMARSAASNVSGFSPTLFLHPAELFHQLDQRPLEIHGFNDSMIDRAFFLAFLALFIPMFRRTHVSLALYAAAVGLISVVGGSFVSYSRYVLMAFPAVVTVALLLRHKRTAVLWTPLLYLLVMVQSLLIVLHSLNYWVA